MRGAKQTMDEIELDLGRYELRRRGRRVKLEKKPMELLIFLVGRREQLVSRKDIVTKLWRSDLFIDTEPNINNIVRKIRTALGDNSPKPRFLETVVGKGYRFIGPVRVIDARFQQTDLEQNPARAANREGASLRGERVVACRYCPCFCLGGIPDDQGVCLGFADATGIAPREFAGRGCAADLGGAEHAGGIDSFGDRLTAGCALCGPRRDSECQRGSGVFRWRCLTPTCKTLASRENAIST